MTAGKKKSVTPEYFNRRKKQATLLINKWTADGVPINVYQRMEYIGSPLISQYKLKQIILNEATTRPATPEPTIKKYDALFIYILLFIYKLIMITERVWGRQPRRL